MRRERKSHIWDKDPDDFYIEPYWCSQRLFDEESFEGGIVDPCCGVGRIIESAVKAGVQATGFDKICRNTRFTRRDYTDHTRLVNVVSNPPYSVADHFLDRMIEITMSKIALLMPATWHLGDKRSRKLETLPLRRIWFLTPRPSMPPGAVILTGEKPGGGREDFAWYVFLRGYDGHAEARWLRRDDGSNGEAP